MTSTYFDQNGLLVETLSQDIKALGPVALGTDNRTWSYDGGVWKPDPKIVQYRAAKLLLQRFRPAHANAAYGFTEASLETISCDPVPNVINFRNGLLHWQTGELRPHNPECLSTVQLPVVYDPEATCPEFDTFLREVVAPDAVDLMWEITGYAMYSGNPMHKAIMLKGSGRNGKGTYLRVLEALLGPENVSAVELQHLSDRFAKADLFGKIANIAGDISGNRLEDPATFKAMTGEDLIRAEHKGLDSFKFTCWALPLFSANKLPPSADSSPGFVARWIVVDFPNSFEGREDKGLSDRLKAELPGIAAKAIPALRRLMECGQFSQPESTVEAKAEFVRRLDNVATWLDEATEASADAVVDRTFVFNRYRGWCMSNGERAESAADFYDKLENRGYRVTKSNGKRVVRGLTVQ